MSESNTTNAASLVLAAVVGASLLAGGLALAGVFTDDPGVEIDKHGVEIDLPDTIEIGKKKK
ncbi:MAG: hypothetical protein R3F61_29620 [Myxococcota bacterium]